MAKTLQFSVAPEQLWQKINPWTFYQQGARFGGIDINLGTTPYPEIEQKILEDVGSYGRQIGRLSDVLEVLLRRLPQADLTPEEQDAVDILRGQIAAVRQVKQRVRGGK